MKINQYLDTKSISATTFAKKVGVPTSTITRIMSGDVRFPQLITQQKIVKAADGAISYDDLWNLDLLKMETK